jgi:hypothetical protein
MGNTQKNGPNVNVQWQRDEHRHTHLPMLPCEQRITQNVKNGSWTSKHVVFVQALRACCFFHTSRYFNMQIISAVLWSVKDMPRKGIAVKRKKKEHGALALTKVALAT